MVPLAEEGDNVFCPESSLPPPEESSQETSTSAETNPAAPETTKPTSAKPTTSKKPTTTTKAATTTKTTTPTTTKKTSTTQAPTFRDDLAQQALVILNQERAAVGKGPLQMNSSLLASAKVRAQEIVGEFSHTRPNGTNWITAITISHSCAAENIAAGRSTARSVINLWLASAGHKKNMLDEDNKGYTDIGFACVHVPGSEYGYYWVQLFIKK